MNIWCLKMKLYKKLLLVSVVFLLLSSYGGSLSVKDRNKIKETKYVSLLDGSNLEVFDGFKILYINGSYYEMGYQHGFLLSSEVQENVRAFIDRAEFLSSYEEHLNIWNKTKPYVPSCFIEEMRGIADGANISFEDLAVSYMAPLYSDLRCFSFAAWSNATIDGKLYHIRSLDYALLIKDPVSGNYTQENSVIIVRKPENGLKSINPTVSGWINFYEGINEKQVSISVQICWSDDNTLKGIPTMFRVQKALDCANDINQAIDILTSNKTLGWNFIVSDAKTSEAYAVETTANHSYVGTWDNPVENKYPYWEIANVVRRTNFFIEPEIAETQRSYYNIRGLVSILNFLAGNDFFFLLWRKYKSMSKEIEINLGNINLNTSIHLLRKVYSGKTDIILFFFIKFYRSGIFCDFHQWSVCPETGEFVISFADATNNSHKTKLFYFNIYNLLEK